MPASRAFVHVVLEGFHQACRDRDVSDLVAWNQRLGEVLARHAPGFRKPALDEAVFAGEPPWRRSGQRDKPGSPLDWGGSLRDAISFELQLDCSIGIAATGVAARLAARLAGPRGVLVWMSGRERDLIDGMPLEELDELRPEQLARLRSQGVTTLDALAELGPSEARALIGIEGERLVGLVRGGVPSLDPPPETRASGPRAESALLAKRLSRKLEKGRLRARGLELAIAYADGVTRERHTSLPRPTSAPEDLAEAAVRLSALASRSTEAVVGLSLTATGLSSAEQLDLFGAKAAREVRVSLGRPDPRRPAH